MFSTCLDFVKEFNFYIPNVSPDGKEEWFWIRPLAIPVERGDGREELKSFFQMKVLLLLGKIIILFPEGGRTGKGEDFLYSQKGKRIRIFKDGLGWLVLKTRALVVPVWVEGTDKVLPNVPDRLFSRPNLKEKITIKIGNPLRFEGLPAVKRERATQMIANVLLKLADEPH